MGRTMLEDMVQSTEQHPNEEVSSPLIAQILEFQESELFSETLQNSEVSCTSTNTNIDHTNYSLLFDSTEDNENDISISIDYNNSTSYTLSNYLDNNQQNHNINYSTLSNPNQVTDHRTDVSLSQYPSDLPLVPFMGPDHHLAQFNYEEECLSAMPSYTPCLASTSTGSCSMFDPTMGQYVPDTTLSVDLSTGIFPGGYFFLGNDLFPQELDFQGDNGGFLGSHSLQKVYNFTSELQPMSNESQLVNVVANSTSLTPEMSGLDDPSFKVGKLTAEERREKIHRYMKKRNERNFSKKLKYACRKTLADSRPRVRGRFAKNDELEMMHRVTGSIISNHEEDDEDVIIKDEDDMIDSDIFAHISGVNSFKCNNPLQSWI